MTYIVVTNDDGIQAPGILALAQAMRQIGTVQVIAPSVNQSSTGHKKTLFQDIIVRHVTLADGTDAVSVGGSPADCIALAALEIIPWPPDIVVSGINRGANLGHDITYSGTVTAALESTIQGVPAVAVSLDHRTADRVEDYAEAARLAAIVVRQALAKKALIPPYTVLNLNVPRRERVRGLRLTRQGLRIYNDEIARQPGDDGAEICRIVGPEPTGRIEEAGTDVWAVAQGYASLTPIHLDMTAHRFIADLAAWDITAE
ncbi:MAG: 5'/3'-nucleotidase SurE [Candidatus Flexifilum sp.]|jgi:5'-nucleotidase